MTIFTSIGQIIAPFERISRATRAAASFFFVIDSAYHPLPGLRDPRPLANKDITFNDVQFAYPSRPHVKVLENLSLTFQTGKVTAIVGPSGSGKSTVVGLIQKWYSLKGQNESPLVHPANLDGNMPLADLANRVQLQGNVHIGGVDIDDIETRSWRSQIGLVAQTPFLFNDTIRNNVLFGLKGTEWEFTDSETQQRLLEEACREAFADGFISRLPGVSFPSLISS
jgi:ATP-binding cassette, subfamily B (MDR/TAP), member 1